MLVAINCLCLHGPLDALFFPSGGLLKNVLSTDPRPSGYIHRHLWLFFGLYALCHGPTLKWSHWVGRRKAHLLEASS